MRIQRMVWAGLCFVLLTACTTLTRFGETMTDQTLTTSPNDTRAYRVVTLDNGLTAILASDPDSEKAAAALDVAVGSQDDPPGREGLAHFLEHMLFLGTQKYPEAGAYQAFINQHGGSHNAFTASDHTNYFFDVDADYLEPALDRFAQQFTAPLFNPEYVEREKNAVHSEYTSKLKDDGRRLYAVLKSVLNPDHPVSRFTVGNLDTLADRPGHPVREDLLNFYQTHYSAERMRLVVVGTQDLDTLERWVREKFSDVPVQAVADKPDLPPLLTDQQTGRRVELRPEKDRRSLTLLYPVPSSRPFYRNKPLYYLTHLIGHEGQGSLLSWLKQAGLAEALSAGVFMDDGQQSLLSISITLTPKGDEQTDTVLAATDALLARIRERGIEAWRFDEQRRLLDIAFRFQERSQPIHFASSVAGRMHLYPIRDVLYAPYRMDLYDAERLYRYAQALTPERRLVIRVSPNARTDRVEPWYQVPYGVYPQQPTPQSGLDFSDIHLPAANEFIPEKVDWAQGQNMTQPAPLEGLPGIKAWWAHDLSFRTPKASFYVSLRSPVVNDSAEHFVHAQLLVDLVRDQLNEYVYPAHLAGLDFRLYRHLRGMTLRIDGYSEKQSVLLEKVARTLRHPEIDEKRLIRFKQEEARQLRNLAHNKPFEQLIQYSRNWLMNPYWSPEEQLAALQTVTEQSMQRYAQDVFSQLDVVTLTVGNVDERAARQLNTVVHEQFVAPRSAQVEVPRAQVVDLPEKVFAGQLRVNHPDTGYLYYVQGPSRDWKDRALYSLIGQIIAPAYYERLRTEQQLGYIVFASPYPMLEVPGLAFIVQSPRASAEQLYEASERFLKQFTEKLKALDEAGFNLHKQAVITRLSEEEKRLEQRADRYWTEIDRKNYAFDSRQRLIQAVKGLTLSEVLTSYRKQFVEAPAAILLTTRHDSDPLWLPDGLRPLPEKTNWQHQARWFAP